MKVDKMDEPDFRVKCDAAAVRGHSSLVSFLKEKKKAPL